MPYCIKQSHCHHHCPGERNGNLPQHPEFTCSIDPGRFKQIIRQIFKEGFDYYHVIGTNGTRQCHCPIGVHQSKILHHQIGGNGAAPEEHGEYNKIHKNLSPRQIILAQRIGHQHRKKHVDGSAQYGDIYGYPHCPGQKSLLNDPAIGFQGNRLRNNNKASVFQDLLNGGQRYTEHIQQRKNTDKSYNKQNDIYKAIDNDVRLSFYHSALSHLLANLFVERTIIIPMTDFNNPTALARL